MQERRHPRPIDTNQLRDQLNGAQREVLRVLEYFGWQLHFVRRANLLHPVAMIHGGGSVSAMIRADGSIDDEPDLPTRH